MRLVPLTASTAALLLSSTALLAQQIATPSENVMLDVGGAPILVPIAVAAEACDLDEAGVQQASQSRIDQSELDEVSLQQLFAASGPSGTLGSTGDDGTETAATVGTDAIGAGTETSTADASTGSAGAGSDSTSAAEASNTPAPGGEPVDVDDLGGSTDTASSEASTTGTDDLIEGAETTAADTAATLDTDMSGAQGLDGGALRNDQLLTLAVCQVDAARASDLGISGIGTDTSGD